MQHTLVLDAYTKGMHNIFIMYAPIIGVCALISCCIKDNGVAEKDARKEDMAPLARIQTEMGEGVRGQS